MKAKQNKIIVIPNDFKNNFIMYIIIIFTIYSLTVHTIRLWFLKSKPVVSPDQTNKTVPPIYIGTLIILLYYIIFCLLVYLIHVHVY